MRGKAGVAGFEVSHETTELDHQNNCHIKEKNDAQEQSTEGTALCLTFFGYQENFCWYLDLQFTVNYLKYISLSSREAYCYLRERTNFQFIFIILLSY